MTRFFFLTLNGAAAIQDFLTKIFFTACGSPHCMRFPLSQY